MKRSGHDKLSCWFGLSYASFLTLPRVAMEAMPDKWQGKMADLLNELDDTFPNFPSFHYRVQRVDGNKFGKFPKWLLNYRYPNYEEIKKWSQSPKKEGGGMYSLKRCDKCGGYKVEIKEEPQPKEPITFRQEAPEPCKCEVSHET